MTTVIDIEGFQVKNKFYAKELAVVYLSDLHTAQWIFKSPFPYTEITDKDKSTVYYCEKHLHGIRWSRGHIDYNLLTPTVASVCKSGDIVYAKGRQKKEFLQRIVPEGVDVRDLEEINCPRFEQLKVHEIEKRCALTSHQRSSHCALRKAFAFSNWLQSKVSYERENFS